MGEAIAPDCPILIPTTSNTMDEPTSDSKELQGIWRLPPEIRNQIYEELLVTDCAFRLGHHGPYSHENRKSLHPEILRTCSQAYHEAVAILYGNNTFFLGPVGFKPTYSASFLTSIGPPNALRIRTIVAHCIHPSLLTQPYLARWFSKLGLDYPSLKIIAFSFNSFRNDVKHHARNMPHTHPPALMPGFGALPGGVPVLGSQWPATTHTGFMGAATFTAGLSAPLLPPVTSPGQQQQGQGQGQGHVRVDSMKDDNPEGEYESAAVRNKGWLEKRKRSEVEGLVALGNTDLRAGEDWLVFVSPAVKKRMGRKIW